ncbi:MAG TPA: hypothetical protein VMS30_02990 [Phycisphaerales bacterium]|nr:hypothetical protein [Phycisphaerales bacterium]
MRIRFSKSRHGPVLICTRDDGSVTGMKSERHGGFFVRHDLMHYAVETVLGIREAFWGLVAGLDDRPSWSIEAFNVPGASKGLPSEAVITEFIVGLIDQAAIFSDKPLVADDVNRDLQQAMSNSQNLAPPAISQRQLDQIMQRFMDLYAHFQSLPDGGHLDLEFPSATGEAIEISDGARETANRGWPRARR